MISYLLSVLLENIIVAYSEQDWIHITSFIRSHILVRTSESSRIESPLEDLESKVSQTAEKFFAEGLLLEGREFCLSLLPFLSHTTQERLRVAIVGP